MQLEVIVRVGDRVAGYRVAGGAIRAAARAAVLLMGGDPCTEAEVLSDLDANGFVLWVRGNRTLILEVLPGETGCTALSA